VYSVAIHGRMIADRVRTEAYARALRESVTSESVVLDLGTGTGLFAILACRFGARKVFAVEPGEIIHLARRLAHDNDVTDRIEFIQKLSTDIELPEPVDMIVSDLRGVVPLFNGHIPSIVDARRRLLRSGGTLIPRRDTVWVALASAPELYRRVAGLSGEDAYGVELSALRDMLVRTPRKGMVTPEELITEPLRWTVLDYATIEQPNVRGTLEWTISRDIVAHGLVQWFDSELTESVGFSTAPWEPEMIYGRGFLPWNSEVALEPGDKVVIDLAAHFVSDDYIWRWNTRILRGGNDRDVKAQFDQSSFGARAFSVAGLIRQKASP
jgi:protein arginine N-methyltransferase 1